MKYIKTFEDSQWENEGSSDFERVVPKRKIDEDFEIKAESIANLILNCPEYSRLKELALRVEMNVEFGPGEEPSFFHELEKCFPGLNLNQRQLVNTGAKVPFYGRMKKIGVNSDDTADFYLPMYIAQKVQEPGYKY